MSRRRTTILIVLTAMVSIVLYELCGGPAWIDGLFGSAGPEPAKKPQRERIHAIGTLQPASGVISLFATSGARLEQLSVKDGDTVKKNQRLGRLDNHKPLGDQLDLLKRKKTAAAAKNKADIKLAEVQLKKAQLALTRAQTQKAKNLELQGQQVALLGRKSELARKRVEALTELKKNDDQLVSASELQSLQFAADTAALEWEHATLTSKFAEQSADRDIEEYRANQDAAKAVLEQLKDQTALDALDAEIQVAQRNYEASELQAPAAGTVLKTYLSKGDTVTRQPILLMGDLTQMVCIAEVYDSAAKSIEPGQSVTIRSPAFKGPARKSGVHGTVSRVGKMVASPGLRDPNPLAQSGKRVVEVEITIPKADVAPEVFESLQLVDLQVNVEFHPLKKP